MKLIKLSGLVAAISVAVILPAQANAAAPVSTEAPILSGTPEVGETFSVTQGNWEGSPTSFTYAWFQCPSEDAGLVPPVPLPPGEDASDYCSQIRQGVAPINSPTYVVGQAGSLIRVRVTATNPDGSTAVTSNNVGPVESFELTPSASLSLTARSGSLFNNAFKSADWRVETGVSAPNPPNASLLPTRETTLNLPGPAQMRFNPGNMPVCPDNQIGPDTNNSVEIPVIVAKCSTSLIGNGTATFLLNRVNDPGSSASLNAQVLIFNGGLVGGQPRLKFWAYSYNTGVAIYTEGVLSPSGVLSIPIPQLTADSAVNSLNVNIPGETITQYLADLDRTVVIPGGKKADYVQAKCDTGTFPFSADGLFGRRLSDNTPLGSGEVVTDFGEDVACTGVRATAKLARPAIKGPGAAKRGKVATYRVTVRNTGGLAASGVRLRVSGKGVTFNTSIGSIAAGSSKTVPVKAKFRSKGRVKATFLATSSNGGKQKATKTIRVR